MECVGAIDQGTQSTRFFLYDERCKVIASSQVDLPQIIPQAG
jgi:glycerol kinase